MCLGYRQAHGPPVNLARAREDNFHVRVIVAAGFKQRELRGAVQGEIVVRISQRLKVAHLPGEIEDVIHAADQMINHVVFAHIGAIDLDAILDAVNVKKIAAFVRYHRVQNKDFDVAKLDEPVSEVATDKPSPPVINTERPLYSLRRLVICRFSTGFSPSVASRRDVATAQRSPVSYEPRRLG